MPLKPTHNADDMWPWPGYCQACKAPLSPPDRIDCPTCGASDYDE